jgi:hypothetical protein
MLTHTEGVPDDEMAEAIHPDAAVSTGTDSAPPKKKHGRRIIAAMKGVTRTGIETVLGTGKHSILLFLV